MSMPVEHSVLTTACKLFHSTVIKLSYSHASLKQEYIDIYHLCNQIGRPRSGVINTEQLKRKYRYKIANKEAASNADKAFSDKLLKELGDKNHVEFWKSWHRRFCSSNIRPASCINGCHGDEGTLQHTHTRLTALCPGLPG